MIASITDLSPEAKAIVGRVAHELEERPRISLEALIVRIYPFHNTTLAIDVRSDQHRVVAAAADYVRTLKRMMAETFGAKE